MRLVRVWISLVLLFSLPVSGFSAEKLIFALDIIRHGDRTPIDRIPSVPYEWNIGLGQLTAEGMRQEYDMGKRFRQRYVEQTHLLPAKYDRTTMYVYSTDYERTLMSAQSLLMGLYPPGTGPYNDDHTQSGLPNAYQPIPIHTAPTSADNIIIKHTDPEQEKILLQKYVYSTLEWQQQEAALKPNFQRWSELSGFKITKLQQLEKLGNALFIHRLHHAPLPAGLTDAEIQTIIDAGEWVFMAEEKPKQIADFEFSQTMRHIAKYLKNSSEKLSPLRFVLLSAHDGTIARAMSFLEAPLAKWPPYASNLNFSLYETGPRNYVVKVTYNGAPVTIPACGSTVCPLSTFLNFVEKSNKLH